MKCTGEQKILPHLRKRVVVPHKVEALGERGEGIGIDLSKGLLDASFDVQGHNLRCKNPHKEQRYLVDKERP